MYLDLHKRDEDLGAIDGGGDESVLREESPVPLHARPELVFELTLVFPVLCFLL